MKKKQRIKFMDEKVKNYQEKSWNAFLIAHAVDLRTAHNINTQHYRLSKVPCNSFYYKSRSKGNNSKSKCERENLQNIFSQNDDDNEHEAVKSCKSNWNLKVFRWAWTWYSFMFLFMWNGEEWDFCVLFLMTKLFNFVIITSLD